MLHSISWYFGKLSWKFPVALRKLLSREIINKKTLRSFFYDSQFYCWYKKDPIAFIVHELKWWSHKFIVNKLNISSTINVEHWNKLTKISLIIPINLIFCYCKNFRVNLGNFSEVINNIYAKKKILIYTNRLKCIIWLRCWLKLE